MLPIKFYICSNLQCQPKKKKNQIKRTAKADHTALSKSRAFPPPQQKKKIVKEVNQT